MLWLILHSSGDLRKLPSLEDRMVILVDSPLCMLDVSQYLLPHFKDEMLVIVNPHKTVLMACCIQDQNQ